MPCLAKPVACQGCSLEDRGEGFAPAEGPANSPLLFVGEALGKVEALTGRPFMGDAGGMLTRLLGLLGWSRESIRIHNAISCKPPGDWFDERAPWYFTALNHCKYLDTTLAEPHKVIVTLGATALKRVLGLVGQKKIQVKDFHGTLNVLPSGQIVVPTFHPSFLQRGAHNLIGTVLWDLQQAEAAVTHGKKPDPAQIICDPPIDWFRAWVDQVVAARNQDPAAYPISSDVETPDKAGGKDEGEITAEDRSFQILRVNVSCHPDEGITVPFVGPYIDELARLHDSPGHVWGWNCPTSDQRVLTADLRWVEAGALKIGDQLVGFDETPLRSSRFSRRRYKTATVTHAKRMKALVYAMGLSDGSCVKTTGEHQWYAHQKRVFAWVRTTDLKIGQKVQRLFQPWETGASWQHGYLAGFWDGEGTLSVQKVTKTLRMAATQRKSLTLDRVRELLYSLGFNHSPKYPRRAKDAHIAQIHVQGGMSEMARFLGEVRPPRLLDKFQPEQLGALQSWRKQDIFVESVECLGEQEIIGLSTSTHTYVLEGFGAHNCDYDFPRLVAAKVQTEANHHKWVDLMWLWHLLQSDLPRGLGFVAPFYSGYGPWKHLSAADPVRYAAIDALQNHRIGFGLIADLHRMGMYEVAMRHTHLLHTAVLRPAQLLGVKIDRQRLVVFKEQLTDKARKALGEIQAEVPESVLPLTPKNGLTRKPLATVLHVKASAFTRKGTVRAGKPIAEIKQELYAKAELIEKIIIKEVLVCRTCESVDVQRRHRCRPVPTGSGSGHTTPARVELDTASVTRWFWREPFNPDSPLQVLAFIKAKHHLPGKHKKTKLDTTDRETLERLERTTKAPFYRALLDYRAVNKVKGTYVEGTERRLDEHDRLHPQPTFKPSTMRLSYVNPNITNVVADKGGAEGLAAGFRKCVVAGTEKPNVTEAEFNGWLVKWKPTATSSKSLFECKLLEVDFSAIEAVLTGWFAGDPEYMRLAKLGVHAGLASHVLGRPYDKAWPDQQLADYFAEIKKKHKDVYDPAKRFIHGRNYGLTRHGMMRQFPQFFPTEAVAKRYEVVFAKMAPKIPEWQVTTQRLAARQHYLGGDSHPFKYKHWFWSVYTNRRLNATQYYKILAKCRQDGTEPPVFEMNGQFFRMSEGEDAKRALAMYPQGTAAGVLKEALLRLLSDPAHPSYIGDAYFGRTPFRAPIHDSGLFEIPVVIWDRVLPIILKEFQRPVPELPLNPAWGLGDYLSIGVAAKAGLDWQDMDDLQLGEAALAEPIEDDDSDDFLDLRRAVS